MTKTLRQPFGIGDKMNPTHKVQLSHDFYGYRKNTWVKVIPAKNLPYPENYWICQGKWKDHPVGARLVPDDIQAIKEIT